MQGCDDNSTGEMAVTADPVAGEVSKDWHERDPMACTVPAPLPGQPNGHNLGHARSVT
jgi:hypothetical protein